MNRRALGGTGDVAPRPTGAFIMRNACVLLCLLVGASAVSAQQTRQRHAKAKSAQADAPARFVLPDSVRVVRDVAYAEYGDRKMLLDLYLPKQPASDSIPCIMVVHGGGWRSGDKTRFARFAAYLAEQGFAAACISYRLVTESPFPACISDSKAAARWVRTHAGEHGIDGNRIGAIGGSAGAHLVAMMGVSPQVSQLEGDGGNGGVSSAVQAVVAMACPADMGPYADRMGLDADLARLCSPLEHVTAQAPPILLIHSDADRVVDPDQSRRLLQKYQQKGATAELVVIEQAPHSFWNQPQWSGDTLERAAAFFRTHLTSSSPASPPTKKPR